jgi:uncharacterized protein YoxC
MNCSPPPSGTRHALGTDPSVTGREANMELKFGCLAAGLSMLAIALVPSAAAARTARTSAAQRVMQAQIDLLQKQNELLVQQNQAIQQQLSQQKSEIDSLRQQMQSTAQPVAQLQHDTAQMKEQFADIEQKQTRLPFEVGFRTGWGESPYDMPGGFFFGAYLNHMLLSEQDGIPGGFVTGELMAGAILGNHANTNANLVGQLAKVSTSTWLDTIEIQPTVQYHLDPAALGYPELAAFKPYVLGGPAMYINLMSTPLDIKNNVPGNSYRHYDADFQAGGVFGTGFELGLTALHVPAIQKILDKSFVGGEWRYNQMGNGEGFNQYSGSVSFGW